MSDPAAQALKGSCRGLPVWHFTFDSSSLPNRLWRKLYRISCDEWRVMLCFWQGVENLSFLQRKTQWFGWKVSNFPAVNRRETCECNRLVGISIESWQTRQTYAQLLSSAAVLEFFDPKKKVDVKNRRDGKRQAQIFSSVWLGFVWVTGRGSGKKCQSWKTKSQSVIIAHWRMWCPFERYVENDRSGWWWGDEDFSCPAGSKVYKLIAGISLGRRRFIYLFNGFSEHSSHLVVVVPFLMCREKCDYTVPQCGRFFCTVGCRSDWLLLLLGV